MCTCISAVAANGDVIMGRTMDFSYKIEPHIYTIEDEYAHRFMGVGQDIGEITLADGINDAGVCISALYFPGYASYDGTAASWRLGIESTAVTSFVLGTCGSVEHAVSVLNNASIIGVKDNITNSIAPLHWMLADTSGRCVVIEKISDGFHVYDNPTGVLANSPAFPWHMTNLNNYVNVVPEQTEHVQWNENLSLAPFGQGAGTTGLPGDYTSPSRFVRASWLLSHASDMADGEHAVRTGFQVLGNVSIPKGCVVTQRATFDYTQYIVMYNLTACTCHILDEDFRLHSEKLSMSGISDVSYSS